jgi:hypothetical protein
LVRRARQAILDDRIDVYVAEQLAAMDEVE